MIGRRRPNAHLLQLFVSVGIGDSREDILSFILSLCFVLVPIHNRRKKPRRSTSILFLDERSGSISEATESVADEGFISTV